MGYSRFSDFLTILTLFSIFDTKSAQVDPTLGFDGTERNALLALKFEFNNVFLNENWNGLMCYLNDPPLWYGIDCSNGRVTGISLENMELSGNIRADTLYNLTQLSRLSFRNNSISGEMMELSKNSKLISVDLSKNLFSGKISNSLKTLNSLESLQLQKNKFSDNIPDFNQPSLREFNVSGNELSGPIPNTNVLQSFSSSSFTDNPGLCGPPISNACNNSDTGTSVKKNNNSKKAKGFFVTSLGPILLAICVVGLIVLLLLLLFYYKRAKKLKEEFQKRKINQEKTEEISIQISEKSFVEGKEKGNFVFMDGDENFDLGDLLKASAKGLGRGNFGNSYKAVLGNGSAFVVKRLRNLKPLSYNEFCEQLKDIADRKHPNIADRKHPNLFPIVAYYYSETEKLLVYKFAANGNVFTRLHGGRETKDRVPFRWAARLSVAQAVARALGYLHLSTENSAHILVPHGNLKSSNVLIDENDNILVSDYGLGSLIASPIAAQNCVACKSPEYKSHKILSKKSDVWSYGYFLLELLTGRMSTHTNPQGGNAVDLGKWVHRAVREEWTAEIFDSEIFVQKSANHAMFRLLQIAIRCCEKLPEKRPEMAEVVKEVENIKVIEDSEDSEDLSQEQSLTDDTMSMTPSQLANP